MKTLLVVDNHPFTAEGLYRILTDMGFHVVKASTAGQALLATDHIRGIDLMICEMSMNEPTEGLELIRQLRSRGKAIPSLIYTRELGSWGISRIMSAEVDGVVFKHENIHELIKAIEYVTSGRTYFSTAFSRRQKAIEHAKDGLSAKTISILECIASGESNSQIAQKMNIGEKAVEYHRSTILRRLSCRNMAEAVYRAIKEGIINCEN